jgi:hypothetical protein
MRKRDIAAPDRRDLFPISEGLNPKVCDPPNIEQVCRSNFLTKALPISIVLLSSSTEQSAVCSLQSGIVLIILCTAEPQRNTGQRNL